MEISTRNPKSPDRAPGWAMALVSMRRTCPSPLTGSDVGPGLMETNGLGLGNVVVGWETTSDTSIVYLVAHPT